MVDKDPLTPRELLDVTKALAKAGWYYPPDAIEAVHQGRATYHPLAPEIMYPLTRRCREEIQQAMKAADVRQPPSGPEEYFGLRR